LHQLGVAGVQTEGGSMKLLIDFLPIVLFFAVYKLQGIYAATAVLMVATIGQMGYTYYKERALQPIHKVTLALVLVFGALTLALQDERFIKWKPTVLYGGFAVALTVMLGVFKKNFLKILLGSAMELPDEVWRKLGWAWIIYFVFMSSINAYMVLTVTTDQWMNFKLWGYAFPLVFLVGQGVYISKYLPDEPAPDKGPDA
jgi:intracellular septation protein